MNAFTSKKTASQLKGLGVYQIIGGAIGVLLICWALVTTQQTELLIPVYLLMFAFFAFSIYCGVLCLNTKDNALQLSLINQILQIIGFAMFGFAFQYAAGIYLTVGLDLTESFNVKFGAGVSKFDFNFNTGTQRLEANFNFIALGLIIFIERIKKNIRQEQDNNQVSSIGAG